MSPVGNPVVRFLHLGQIGREYAPALDVAEDKLAAQRGDAAVVRESVGHRLPLVVVVDRNGVGKAVLHASTQHARALGG